MRRIGDRSVIRLFGAQRSAATAPTALTRAQVLAKWKGQGSDTLTSSNKGTGGVISRAMAFASPAGAASVRKAAPAATTGSIGDISWDSCERLDHAFTYYAPRGWTLDEKVRENFLSIELTPPRPTAPQASAAAPHSTPAEASPSTHGLTVTAYAYFKKVHEPDSDKLMEVFLRRFNQCMNNSVEVLKRSTPKVKPPVDAAGRPCPPPEGHQEQQPSTVVSLEHENRGNLPDIIASRLGGSACEFTFAPTVEVVQMPSGERGEGVGRARALCRAFFHTNRLHHYVVVMAVPEDEFEASWDLVAHAELGVREQKAVKDL